MPAHDSTIRQRADRERRGGRGGQVVSVWTAAVLLAPAALRLWALVALEADHARHAQLAVHPGRDVEVDGVEPGEHDLQDFVAVVGHRLLEVGERRDRPRLVQDRGAR
jgi:3-keto-L-gulonate-6-phosphate decarboxylase